MNAPSTDKELHLLSAIQNLISTPGAVQHQTDRLSRGKHRRFDFFLCCNIPVRDITTRMIILLMFFSEGVVISLSNSLLSRHEHADEVHNSGVVWGRVSQVHAALLQQVEVTVSVATEWNQSQLPLATTREITQRHIRTERGKFHGSLRVCWCVWTLVRPQSTER